MKIMNMRNKGIGTILLMLTIIVAVGAVNAQKKLESRGGMTVVESTFKERVYPEPPKAVKGVEREFVEIYKIKGHQLAETYPNKFVVWSTDSAATIDAINNPKLIKDVTFSPFSKWAITVVIDDPLKGFKLRENLMKTPVVYRIENYVYDKEYQYERYPTDMLTVCLREESDSTKLKHFADSLSLLCYVDNGLSSKKWWNVHIGPNTCKSRFEIKDLILQRINPKHCELYWDYDRSYMQEFTMDPYVRDQWGLYNLDNISRPNSNRRTDIDVARAWNYVTGRDVRICLIDLGFDITNRDLARNIVKYRDFVTNRDTITVSDYHGTACAGIASAIRNNNFGVAGVAPDSKLLLARISRADTLINKKKITTESQITQALEWAVSNNADIISFSLNCEESIKIVDAINDAITNGREGKGCVFVKSSGNKGQATVTFPGNIPGVITVGAVTSLINVWEDSNYGDDLFVVAPGTSICCITGKREIQYLEGTSYAAPAVAGIAALVLEAYPGATAEDVRRVIGMSASVPTSVPQSERETKIYGEWSQKCGYGFVNAYGAVKYAYKLSDQNLWFQELPFPNL